MKKRNRVYADTSVFGGVYDEGFSEASGRFFDEVVEGKHVVLVSDITARELQGAPLSARQFVADLPDGVVERLSFSGEMADLRDAYLSAGVLGPASSDDAAHVACATVARADYHFLEFSSSGKLGKDASFQCGELVAWVSARDDSHSKGGDNP